MSDESGPNVLVLGVGGNVGQGIIKALRLSPARPRIIGGCIDPLSAGLYLADYACLTPPAASPQFPQWLTTFCLAHRIDAVFSGVDAVLDALTDHCSDLQHRTGAVAIVSRGEAIRLAHDKLATAAWLQQQGFPSPRTVLMDDEPAVRQLRDSCGGYPLVVKPRRGRGSAGVSVVRSDEELLEQRHRRSDADLLVQEHLGEGEGEEYTASCFVDSAGTVRATVAFRRKLLGGVTQQAVAGEFADVRHAAAAIVSRLPGVMGPCNVQLRRRRNELVCFDINMRFSSTCPIRARFGFNDVDAALRHFVLGQPVPSLNETPKGVALRYWNEIYIDQALADRLLAEEQLDLNVANSGPEAAPPIRVEDSAASCYA